MNICYINSLQLQSKLKEIIERMHQTHFDNSGQVLKLLKDWKFKIKTTNSIICQNTKTNNIADAHQVQSQHIYFLTKLHQTPPTHIVSYIGFLQDQSGAFYYLTQRISGRLSDMQILTQNQCIKVLYAIFEGLSQLQQVFGTVGLTQECICFNQEGKVKIWVNPNLSNTRPIKNYAYTKSNNKGKLIVIWETILMLQRKCLNRKIFNKIKQRIQKKSLMKYQAIAQELFKISQQLFLNYERPFYKNSNQQKQFGFHQFAKSTYADTRVRNSNSVHQQQQKFSILRVSPYNDTNKGDTQFKVSQINQKQSKNIKKCPSIANYKFQNNVHNIIKPHRRYKSNMEALNQIVQSQISMNFANRNYNNQLCNKKEKQSLQLHDYTRSAPMSPQKNRQRNSNKEEQLKKMKQQIKNKVHRMQKKIPQKNMIKESCKMDQDSFCRNIKTQNQQLEFSNQFQTFGLLEDTASSPKDKNNSIKQKNIQLQKQIQNKFGKIIKPFEFQMNLNQQMKTLSNRKRLQTFHKQNTNNRKYQPNQKTYTYQQIDKKYQKYVSSLNPHNQAMIKTLYPDKQSSDRKNHRKASSRNSADLQNNYVFHRYSGMGKYEFTQRQTPKWGSRTNQFTKFRH